MRRRDLIALVAGAAVLRPLAATAQAPAKQYRIASVQPDAGWRKWPISQAFLVEMRRLGYTEGTNLVITDFTTAGDVGRYAALARQAVSTDPDAIVAAGDMLPALISATRTRPIVAILGDPLALGQARDLARPGGNFTGVSVFAGYELEGKRLELLKQAVPSSSRISILMTTATRVVYAPWLAALRDYGSKLRLSLNDVVLHNSTPAEIERGFAELARDHPDALLLSPEGALSGQPALIVRLAVKNRVPAIYPYHIYADVGGLMTYAFDPAELGRQLADDVGKVLHGTRVGEIPIYQPTRFKLTINLKTAKAIGLTFPPLILEQADEVIQ